MKILLTFILTLHSINETFSFTLSGYKLRNTHLKYYLLNTPENIDYSFYVKYFTDSVISFGNSYHIDICKQGLKQSLMKILLKNLTNIEMVLNRENISFYIHLFYRQKCNTFSKILSDSLHFN